MGGTKSYYGFKNKHTNIFKGEGRVRIRTNITQCKHGELKGINLQKKNFVIFFESPFYCNIYLF